VVWRQIFLPCVVKDEQCSNRFNDVARAYSRVGQFRRGPISFPLTYLVHLVRFGYWNIPAEKEARDRADELIARYREQPPNL